LTVPIAASAGTRPAEGGKMGAVRLGVDVGGTFTDFILIHQETGRFLVVKVPSRPKDPAGALLEAITKALAEANCAPKDIQMLCYGTTIVTNAVLERTLAQAALITTKGFRDVLEIGRHLRPDMYNLDQDKPTPLIPRDLRFEVNERMAADGRPITPLDRDSVQSVVDAIRNSDAKVVAISFLHSYANAAHEAAMRDAIAASLPEIPISVSVEVCREIREFERTSTVALNAAAMPIVSSHFGVIEQRTTNVIGQAQILLMQSNGGSITMESARQIPAHLVYSGPAAGVLACQFVAHLTGRENVLGFDMGGTSTDISLVHRGQALMTTESKVDGHPIKLPMLDINTIGAGGGSIAYLDAAAGLHVGPRSAGADPGPVAYGRGGTEPTVTDANLLLGRLGSERFLGGALRLDRESSSVAIRKKIAEPLGLDPIRAAIGIVEVANANMERALKVSSAERGYDPRDFTVIAFGGCGPVHAAAVAQQVGFPTVLVPPVSGLFSAFGLLIADIRHDFVRSYIAPAKEVSLQSLQDHYAEMRTLADRALAEDGITSAQREFRRTADLRYVGQAYEVNVPFPEGASNTDTVQRLVMRFHDEHQRLFAHSSPFDPVEIINLRLVAIGKIDPPKLPKPTAMHGTPLPASWREVFFLESDGFVDCPIFNRETLGPGTNLEGPAVVEQLDCTTVVHPGQHLSVDDWGNIIIQMRS
jgi:N-methylhydantoinase A